MKIHRKLSLLVTLCLLLSLLSSCDGDESSPDIETTDIVFKSQATDLISIAVSPDAEVYGTVMDGGIRKYNAAGDLLEEYPVTDYIYGICYANGFLYGYDGTTRNVIELDPQSKEVRVVYEGLEAAEVRSLTVNGGFVVLIVVPSIDNVDWETEDDGFLDLHEKFYTIDIGSGELAEITAIGHPIGLYQSSGGTLYVYAHPENHYILYSYDVQTKKAVEVSVMDDVGYTFGFAYEAETFVYNSKTNNVKGKRMSDGLVYTCVSLVPVALGGCFTYYGGLLLFLDQRMPDDPVDEDGHDDEAQRPAMPVTALQALRLDTELITLQSDGETNQNSEGFVVISAAYYDKYLNTELLEQRSGIKGIYSEQPTNDYDKYQAFLTSILAGDDSIDIYILNLSDEVSAALREQNGYVSLSDSEPINSYLDGCFDWVGDAATAQGGDTWMLPLSFNMPALWYIPENFEQFGLTPADVATFEDYYQTVERLNETKGDYTIHATYLTGLSYSWFIQNQMAYCDFPNGKAAFDTDLYSRFFELMWGGGWYQSNPPEGKSFRHPVLQADFVEPQDRDFSALCPDYDTDRVIFKLEYANNQLGTDASIGGVRNPDDITRWRALPLPRLSEDVDKNYTQCVFAVVNPNSKNKERAIAYLEAAAMDMLQTIIIPVTTDPMDEPPNDPLPIFVQKDLAAYEGVFDMSLPVYQDLYNIYKDGAAIQDIFPYGMDRYAIVEDYQAGKITIDQAVAEIQRQAEIWLNE